MIKIKKYLYRFTAASCLWVAASATAEFTPPEPMLASLSTVHNELLLCGISAPALASDCSDMGPQKLQVLAQLRFAPINCFTFPPEHGCGSNPYQQINFIVVYAATATVEHWRARQVGDGIDISPQPVTAAMQQLAEQALQLHQHYPVMQQYYSFTQLKDGSFVNELGDILDVSAMQAFAAPHRSNDDSFGDCQTALDYMHRSSCSTAINGWIRGVDQQINTPPGWWHNIIDSFAVSLGIVQIGFNSRKFQTFHFTLKYKDGSRLTLSITPIRNNRGSPSIILNSDVSHTSNGDTFTAYKARLLNTNGVEVSGQETRSIFGGTGCSNITQIIGQDVTYLVTVVTMPDGTKYVSYVQKIGSTPIESTRTVCNTPGLPAMF
ncbi:hypothetical protein ACO1PK_13570 [Alishewanella sp. d11]|uniref:hypothetical protein n=1 Tax=Alishewanella sp. d11 TaxID=3414030 RepID=UPI003BF80E0C